MTLNSASMFHHISMYAMHAAFKLRLRMLELRGSTCKHVLKEVPVALRRLHDALPDEAADRQAG